MAIKLMATHEVRVINGKRHVKEHPTLALSREGEPTVIVQHGHLFYDNGEPVPDQKAPDWFLEDYAGVSKAMRELVEFDPPTRRAK